jgi:hypothetical protein
VKQISQLISVRHAWKIISRNELLRMAGAIGTGNGGAMRRPVSYVTKFVPSLLAVTQ